MHLAQFRCCINNGNQVGLQFVTILHTRIIKKSMEIVRKEKANQYQRRMITTSSVHVIEALGPHMINKLPDSRQAEREPAQCCLVSVNSQKEGRKSSHSRKHQEGLKQSKVFVLCYFKSIPKGRSIKLVCSTWLGLGKKWTSKPVTSFYSQIGLLKKNLRKLNLNHLGKICPP